MIVLVDPWVNTGVGRSTTSGHEEPNSSAKFQFCWYLISTLWQFNIAIENGPDIVDLPIKSGDLQNFF